MTSLREVPLKTVLESRLNENFCWPTPMATWKELAPARASNVSVLSPDVTVTEPGEVRRVTTKT